MSEIKFGSDTKQRKEYFTDISFSHPAKMSLPLQLWLIDNYTKAGETILDPMAGSGTILVACSLGRHVIAIDLEQKFVDMMKGNWEKIKQRGPQMGYTMGTATILQGDARNLEGILADKIITSPPYAEAQTGGGIAQKGYRGSKHSPTDLVGRRSYMPENMGQSEEQISNLPYGNIDSIITSDKGQSENNMSVVYITFFEVNNPIVLLVKTLIPSPILSSLPGRAMPEIAIGFNNSSKSRQEKVNEISTNPELTDKLKVLASKIFGNRNLKVGEPSLTITFKGTEDTPVTSKAVWLDIEGIATQSTMAFYLGSADSIEAFTRTILANTSLGFIGSDPEYLVALRTSSLKASLLTNKRASTGAIFASTVCKFTGAFDEILTADLTGKNLPIPLTQITTYNRAEDTIAILQLGLIDAKFLTTLPTNPDNLSTHLITLSILPQSKTSVNCIITSPPYEGSDISQTHMTSDERGDPDNPNYRPSWKRKLAEGYADTKRPYHEVDSIITSPPYEEVMGKKHHSPRADKLAEEKGKTTYTDGVDSIITSPPYAEQPQLNRTEHGILAHPDNCSCNFCRKNKGNKGMMQGYKRQVDAVISSPPYEEARQSRPCGIMGEGRNRQDLIGYSYGSWQHGKTEGNIGNLKSTSYLEAMLAVYRSCFTVLKPGGLMILVVKNFLRDKKEVDLRTDTRKLCEQAGFSFVEEHYRVLTSQSFWRTIYYQKYPDAPKIDKEYIEVFQKMPLEVK